MANRQDTIANRIAEAKDTGKEAIFFADEVTNTGAEYEFTPNGIGQHLVANQGFNTRPQAAAVADATAINNGWTTVNLLLVSLRAAGIIAT